MTRPRSSLAFAAVLVGLLLHPSSSRALGALPSRLPAQMGMMAGDAMGKPLPDSSLPTGTATIRVVRGSFLEPIVDVEVTVTPAQGAARIARTDNEGRATVAGLEPNVEYVASVVADGKQALSLPFTMPESGGVRLALTTVPWTSAGHGTGSMRSSTAQAGRPEVLDSLAPRLLVVRVVADDLDHGVGQVAVHLVGYHADGTVSIVTQMTAADGRVQFPGLVSRGVAYYALATLRRPGGEDRLQSLPIIIADAAGTSLLLAGRAAETPGGADDLDRLYDDQPAPPAGPGPGEVVVRLAGQPADISAIEAAEVFVVGQSGQAMPVPLAPAPPPPSTIRGRATRSVASQHPAGNLTISVIHSDDTRPLANIPVEVMGEGSEIVASGTSAKDGLVEFSGLDLTGNYRIALVVRGKRITTGKLTLPPETGLMVPIAVTWGPDQPTGKLGNLAWGADKVYAIRVSAGGRNHYSAPFQLTSERGASVTIPVTTAPGFRFSLGGGLDNQLMRFQGMFFIHNDSFAPYDPGPKGLALPLPRGFVGAGVSSESQDLVKVESGLGFVFHGPLPPGGGEFHGGFALKVDGGDFDFDLPLPLGADRSNLRFVYLDGVQVLLSGNTSGEVGIDPQSGSQVYEVAEIDLPPGERIVMRVSGLPHHPGWYRHARLAIGLIAIALFGWAIAACFVRRRTDASNGEPQDRREQLLDELTELERRQRAGNVPAARYERSRARLYRELESIYSGREAR